MLGYLRWGWSLGFRRALRLLQGYTAFSVSLLRVWKAHADTGARLKVEAEHQERLRALAGRWGMSERHLMSLDNLRRRPVVGHLRRLMAVLMLDKLIAYVGALGITIAALLLVAAPWSFAVAAASWAGARGLSWWSGRGRSIDCGIDLARASDKIAASVDARIVVFGHTHRPVAQKLESGAWYFNIGTWVPNGRPGLLRAFTHLVIRHTDSGPVASLCQWRDGASRPFTPDWGPAGTPDAVEVAIPNAQEPSPAEAA
jgi:hypothetical protein